MSMEPPHLPAKPNSGPSFTPKRKRNPEDDALQRLMNKREKKYLSQHHAASNPQTLPVHPPWSIINPDELGPHLPFMAPPIHMGFHDAPMPMRFTSGMPPMMMDAGCSTFHVPHSFGFPGPSAPSDSKYTIGLPGTSIGGHSLGDYQEFPPDAAFEWGFNSDEERSWPTGPAHPKPGSTSRKNSKAREAVKDAETVMEPQSQGPGNMQALDLEEGEIPTSTEAVLSASPASSTIVSASSVSLQITDNSPHRHSPSILDSEELVDMARSKLKFYLAEFKELMGKLDEAKTRAEKLRIMPLIKAKDGELTAAQEAVRAAEAELEAVKLMNHAVSTEEALTFNDSKTQHSAATRNASTFRQMSWNNKHLTGLSNHLRFLRISSPPCLIIELDDDDDNEDWEMT